LGFDYLYLVNFDEIYLREHPLYGSIAVCIVISMLLGANISKLPVWRRNAPALSIGPRLFQHPPVRCRGKD
jgi:hypothetical protein